MTLPGVTVDHITGVSNMVRGTRGVTVDHITGVSNMVRGTRVSNMVCVLYTYPSPRD